MSSTSLEATLRTFPGRNVWNVLCHESWCTHSIQTKRLTEGLKYNLVVVWSVCWAEIIIKILGNLLAVSNPKPYLMNPEKTANTEPKCHMSYTWEVFCMWLSLFMWEGDLCLCFPNRGRSTGQLLLQFQTLEFWGWRRRWRMNKIGLDGCPYSSTSCLLSVAHIPSSSHLSRFLPTANSKASCL